MKYYKDNPPLRKNTSEKCEELLKLSYKIDPKDNSNFDLQRQIIKNYHHILD